ncbi:DoxX [Chlamydia abortus]|uniref:DoxX family protein n=1 Tax=Paenibacillus residui TaxID=629724 RepID=A0ABW3DIY0_9BACL|nr:DoxX family protein [Paenibacillus sp. 32O-W]SHE14237.1 DoxX [Chlamydia abortus]
MIKWLRENRYAAVALLLLRVYVGWQWMSAGWGKIFGDKPFDAGGYLQGAIANPVADKATQELVYPTYMAFIEKFALPNVKLFNFMIPWGEFLVGLGLILGALTTAAAFFGLLMNFMFLFAGTISTNPWMVLLGGLVFIAGANAGKLGADYYLLPYMRNWFNKWRNKGRPGDAAEGQNREPAHA